MNIQEIAKLAYRAYGEVTDFKNFQGNPMPEWEQLTPTIQRAWVAAVTDAQSRLVERIEPPLDKREVAQIMHARNYAGLHADAGVPGHGQFMLIAKLAKVLGLG